MKLSPEAIAEFQTAYLMDFGQKIDKKEAEELGQGIINFLTLIFNHNEHEL